MKYSLTKLIGMLAIAGLIGVSCESITDSEVEKQPDNQIETLGTGELVMPSAVPANAEIFWYQDFSENADGWLDSDDSWVGTVTFNSALETATFEGGGGSAPFSRFDGYRSEWPGDYFAEIEVYLDPNTDPNDFVNGKWGFDYAVASSRSDGDHLRDFIFHVGFVDGVLLVNGSNNADFTTNSLKLQNENGGENYTVTEAGWYTLQHSFYEKEDGSLAVDLNLFDELGTLLWSATRNNPADDIAPIVGGNRYSWFTHTEASNGIEVDNHSLYKVIEDPTSIEQCKDGGFEEFGFRNQGQCVRYVNTSKDSR